MKDLLLAFLSKTLNKDVGEITSLVYKEDGEDELLDGALEALLDADKTRVKDLQEAAKALIDTQEHFQNGFKKAKGEVLTEFETNVKQEYGIESDKTGIDLLNDVIAAKVDNAGEVTDDVVRNHNVYKNMLETKTTEITKLTDDHKVTLETKEKEFGKHKTLTTVNDQALVLIDGLNPVLSKDVAKAKMQKQVILDKLGLGSYAVSEENVITLLKEDGNMLTDDHGVEVKFADRVKSLTELHYDLQEAKKRTGGGGEEDDDEVVTDPKEGWAWNGLKPKDGDAFNEAVGAAGSFEERKAITDAWTKKDGE